MTLYRFSKWGSGSVYLAISSQDRLSEGLCHGQTNAWMGHPPVWETIGDSERTSLEHCSPPLWWCCLCTDSLVWRSPGYRDPSLIGPRIPSEWTSNQRLQHSLYPVFHQWLTNIRIFEYIRIFSNEYIHIRKYSAIFIPANIFGYSFGRFLNGRIYSIIRSIPK